MRGGITTAFAKHSGIGDHRAGGGNRSLNGRNVPCHRGKCLAAESHGQADFHERDVRGLGQAFGSLDEGGDVEGFDDAQRAGRLDRARAPDREEHILMEVGNHDMINEAPVRRLDAVATADSTPAVSPAMRIMYFPEQIERERRSLTSRLSARNRQPRNRLQCWRVR